MGALTPYTESLEASSQESQDGQAEQQVSQESPSDVYPRVQARSCPDALGWTHDQFGVQEPRHWKYESFVSPEFSQSVHNRFADELEVFVARYAVAGEVIHVADSSELASFTFTVPAKDDSEKSGVERDVREAGDYPCNKEQSCPKSALCFRKEISSCYNRHWS